MLQPKDRVTEWLQKQDPYICCLQETHFRYRNTQKLKVRILKKVVQANRNQKKAGVAIFISGKIGFKIKIVTRDKEGHYIIIKGTNPEEDITLVNIYAPNIGTLQYIRQILVDIKGAIDSNTIIAGDFNTSLTSLDRSSRQKINKETLVLNDTLDEMDLIDIYRAFHLKAAKSTFFSSAHRTFCRIDHMIGHKTSLSKFKKIEILPGIFSNHNTMRLEINYKEKKLQITQIHEV